MALADLPDVNQITSFVIRAAVEVHRHLGAGLLESAYLACLVFELRASGLRLETQKNLPLAYKGMRLECVYRLDLVVEDRVIVEVKCIERFASVHRAQLVTYLKLTGAPAGLLINFNVPVLKQGLKRVLNASVATSDLRASVPP